ncbi:MAG: 30S ribosomal protein S5 [Proteobacteria bacterium]|nr:30S ribosomal protein S5 [Pseudomonadota bacterium]NBX85887.1 30S ribosomal protein S5 [Pseudomonadota bacterium]
MNTEITATPTQPTTPAATESRPNTRAPREGGREGGRNEGRDGREGGRRRDREGGERERSELVDKLVGVRRVAKTVKGGRRMAFGALVVVGDEAGRVGFGKGKAKEVPDAVKKATEEAKRRMVRVALRQGRTMHHEVRGRFGATRVVIKPAVPGTGIIAGGPMRAVFEAMGIKDVVAKAMGSTNPFNLIRATFAAFAAIETPRGIAAKRGLKVTDLLLHKNESSKGEVDQKEMLEKAEKAKAKRAANRPDKGGNRRPRKEEGERKPRRDAQPRRAEGPKVVTVTKGESMMKATTEAPAETAAATTAPAETPKAE